MQGCRKCGNQEGASREIVHARGKLISCKSSKIKIIRKELQENHKTDCTNFLAFLALWRLAFFENQKYLPRFGFFFSLKAWLWQNIV